MFWIKHGLARLLVACVAACALMAVGACSNSQTGKKQPLVVTVGHDNADVIGDDNVAIQKAVDRVAAAGGGVVRIKAGTYIFSNWVRLASHMTLEGEGPDKTILKKGPRVASRVTVDADSTETEATVEDASPFKPGMGVVVFDDHLWCRYPYVRTVLRIEGSKLIFDDILEVDHAAAQSAMASNCFPLIAGINVEDDQVRNLTVEGNRTGKEPYAEAHLVDPSALLFYGSKKFSIRGVVARNFAGDGISAWYAEDPTIEDCESYGNTGLGIHLGSRALRGQVRHNRSHNNQSDGIYLCWGVQGGTWEDNQSIANDGDGISIGHKDTDNIFIKNVVRENGKAGVYFRDDPESTAGHRNSFRENIIENNGRLSHPGYGIRIDGATQHIELISNAIRETRTGAQARQNVGLCIGPHADYVVARQNEFSGAMQQKIQDKSAGGHNKFD
jgi:parallel beta-helix repeat protein